MKRALVLSVTAAVTAMSTARAQSARLADSLLERGRLDRAESLYYAAVRTRPRDPVARLALGRYLAARGAQRVAVPLLEEALQFGGDAPAIGAELAPLYLILGEYHALATLPSSPLTAGEKTRATWLEAHPTRFIAPDSVLTASYREPGNEAYVGRMPIRVNGHIVDAFVDVSSHGLTLSDSAAGAAHVRTFVEKSPRSPGVLPAAADSFAIGRLSITNAPLAVAAIKVPATIGLDVLARFAPTFDARAGRVTLRVSGTFDQAPASALVLSTLVKSSDWLVLQANGWLSLRDATITRLLHDKRWTLDAKRGQLVVE